MSEINSTPNKIKNDIVSFLKTPTGLSFIVWLAAAELLMLFLLNTKESDLLVFVANFLSFYIKSLESLKHINVFNNQIAWIHYALMLTLSLPLAVFFIFLQVGDAEKNPAIRGVSLSKKICFTIFLIFLSWVSFSFEFYTGIYSFFLARTPYGFAASSAMQAFFIPFFLRLLKLLFSYKG